jgi:hypothetical protein
LSTGGASEQARGQIDKAYLALVGGATLVAFARKDL